MRPAISRGRGLAPLHGPERWQWPFPGSAKWIAEHIAFLRRGVLFHPVDVREQALRSFVRPSASSTPVRDCWVRCRCAAERNACGPRVHGTPYPRIASSSAPIRFTRLCRRPPLKEPKRCFLRRIPNSDVHGGDTGGQFSSPVRVPRLRGVHAGFVRGLSRHCSRAATQWETEREWTDLRGLETVAILSSRGLTWLAARHRGPNRSLAACPNIPRSNKSAAT